MVPDIVKIIDVEGANPRPGWADSYSADGSCHMQTTFDHGIGDVEVETPQGTMTISELYELLGPGPDSTGHPLYNDIQCGNGPPHPGNNGGDESTCPGLVEYDSDGCGQIGPLWDLSELE